MSAEVASFAAKCGSFFLYTTPHNMHSFSPLMYKGVGIWGNDQFCDDSWSSLPVLTEESKEVLPTVLDLLMSFSLP